MPENTTDKNALKSWFKRGLKPTALQFTAWMDSYWHKSEQIPTATIEGLETILNSKAESADITSIRTGMEEHANDYSRHKTAAEQSKLDNLAENADATYARKVRLEDLETYVDEQDAAGLQTAKDYTDALAGNVYKKVETDNKYVFKTDMPTALRNPNAITFTGAVSDTYDGSVAKTVNIPEGLSLGETSATAYRGDRGKMAYDYSQGKRSKADLDTALQGEIDSKLSKGSRILAGNTAAGGYSFIGEGNYDTGMFSDSDGDLYFKKNDLKYLPVWEGDSRLSNARPANGGNSATCSGNAATATRLQTARTINGVSFDGSANINISNSWNEVTGKPTFAAVATTGNYNDLLNKPATPSLDNYVTLDTAQTITGAKTFTSAITGSAGFYDTSDRRLKDNIKPIALRSEKIKLYEFDKNGKHSYGVIAQEMEALYPTTVEEGADGYKLVNYNEVLAIKCSELENENNTLNAKLDKLEQILIMKGVL